MKQLPLQSHHLMEKLSIKGHKIIVLDYEKRTEEYSKNLLALPKIEIVKSYKRIYKNAGVTLIRSKVSNVPLIDRISYMLSHSALVWNLIRRVDVVLCYSVSPSMISIVSACKTFKKPLVFHSFDVLHHLTKLSKIKPFLFSLEKYAYLNSDMILTVTPALNKYLAHLGLSSVKVFYLPVGIDTGLFQPIVEKENIKRKWGILPEEKVVLFTGRLFDFSGLDMVIKGMPKILDILPNTKLVIAGDGPLYTKLVMLTKKLHLSGKVMLLGRQPYSKIPELIGIADLCINPFKPHILSLFAFPSKIVEYMAVGKAVLATNLLGTKEVLNNVAGVKLVSQSNFLEAMLQLLKDENSLLSLGMQARLCAEKIFSLDVVCSRLEEILYKVVHLKSERYSRKHSV